MNTSAKWPQTGAYGPIPGDPWVTTSAPAGATQPWKRAPIGQDYAQLNLTTKRLKLWKKWERQGADTDWALGLACCQFTFTRAAMTDGGGTSGTYTFSDDPIPAGAVALRTQILGVTGFAGNTSAVITIGDGSTANRYNTGTPNVFATAAHVDAGAISGTAFHAAAINPVVTITSATDFTNVSAGQATIRIWYLR